MKKCDLYHSPDLQEPHILRSLANVPIVSIHTSHSACHAVALDKWGTAYLFGRNTASCLGTPASADAVISEQAPRAIRPAHVGAPNNTKFVSAACGRSHTLLITDTGEVYSAGNNTLGQVCAEIIIQWSLSLSNIAGNDIFSAAIPHDPKYLHSPESMAPGRILTRRSVLPPV